MRSTCMKTANSERNVITAKGGRRRFRSNNKNTPVAIVFATIVKPTADCSIHVRVFIIYTFMRLLFGATWKQICFSAPNDNNVQSTKTTIADNRTLRKITQRHSLIHGKLWPGIDFSFLCPTAEEPTFICDMFKYDDIAYMVQFTNVAAMKLYRSVFCPFHFSKYVRMYVYALEHTRFQTELSTKSSRQRFIDIRNHRAAHRNHFQRKRALLSM